MPQKPQRPVMPSTDDAELAAKASRYISLAQEHETELRLQAGDDAPIALPNAAREVLHDLLDQIARGNAVALIPVQAELTTQEAADHLNVSRPHLIKLLETGKIPFHMVGSHRRIRFGDIESFRKQAEAERQRLMDELANEAQTLGMGY